MLIAASLLISPYAAGNSVLAVLAVGIIPLFQSRPRLEGLLIALIDLAFLPPRDWQAYYATAILLLAWAVLAWRVVKGQDILKIPEPAAMQPSLSTAPG
jgi:DNA-binding transcriptional LysR family regulator